MLKVFCDLWVFLTNLETIKAIERIIVRPLNRDKVKGMKVEFTLLKTLFIFIFREYLCVKNCDNRWPFVMPCKRLVQNFIVYVFNPSRRALESGFYVCRSTSLIFDFVADFKCLTFWGLVGVKEAVKLQFHNSVSCLQLKTRVNH